MVAEFHGTILYLLTESIYNHNQWLPNSMEPFLTPSGVYIMQKNRFSPPIIFFFFYYDILFP
jgi:hypothetical protein